MITNPCRACGGTGGFNQFTTLPGNGTSYYPIHIWIACSRCDETGQEPLRPLSTPQFASVVPELEEYELGMKVQQ